MFTEAELDALLASAAPEETPNYECTCTSYNAAMECTKCGRSYWLAPDTISVWHTGGHGWHASPYGHGGSRRTAYIRGDRFDALKTTVVQLATAVRELRTRLASEIDASDLLSSESLEEMAELDRRVLQQKFALQRARTIVERFVKLFEGAPEDAVEAIADNFNALSCEASVAQDTLASIDSLGSTCSPDEAKRRIARAKIELAALRGQPFRIGSYVRLHNSFWKVTDVGTRTIAAIRFDPGWMEGPPYALDEVVFDENDQKSLIQIEQAPGKTMEETVEDLLNKAEGPKPPAPPDPTR